MNHDTLLAHLELMKEIVLKDKQGSKKKKKVLSDEEIAKAKAKWKKRQEIKNLNQ